MDGGAWYATVHGVAKIRTILSNFTFFRMYCIYVHVCYVCICGMHMCVCVYIWGVCVFVRYVDVH